MEQEKIIKRILKRNLIADFIEVYSLLICLVPILLIFVIQSSIWVSTIVLSVFFLIFYLISSKDIQKIWFTDDEIKFKYLFKLKNKLGSINYSFIKSINHSATKHLLNNTK